MARELVSCPACGRKNASDRTTCLACNANLTPETGDSIKGVETTSDPTLANPHPTQNVKAPTVNWFKAGTLFALCLIAFSFLYYYVIFLPRVQTAKLEKETREKAKQQAAAEKTLTGSPSILEEQEKARRELEQAQTEHERQVREHEAKERGKWEAPSDNAYVTIADISVYKWPMLGSEIAARIPKAMKVYVVGVRGNWLKIESKMGNPSGYIEKKYALVEKEAKKLLCLAQADGNYRANWDKTCAVQGRAPGCTLLAPVVANLNQNHRAARDECFRLYPQR